MRLCRSTTFVHTAGRTVWLSYHSRPRGATPASLSLSLHLLSIFIVARLVFSVGEKAKKVLFFSGAPANLALSAPRHSPAPAESPRRGSAGPWAPRRPFSDQKVGRRRSGARLFAFLSNDFSFFWGATAFPFLPAPVSEKKTPGAAAPGVGAPAPTPSSPALSHTPGRRVSIPKKSGACASGAQLFCRSGEGALL